MWKKVLGLLLGTIVASLISGAEAADKVKLKMAEVVRSQFYVPMYVAISKGFLADEGLEVELVTTNGGDRAGAMVLSDQADFALAGPEVPIYIYNGESPDKPVIFCALTATDGLFFASRTKIDKFEWTMVNNKRIMGWRPGSTPELYLEYVFKMRGVSPETIKAIITNVSPAARDGAFMAGGFDFAIMNEPNLSRLEKAGEAYFAGSTGKEIGRADYTVFFAKRSWVDKHPQLAQQWTNAIARGQSWVMAASDQEVAEAVAPFFPGLTIADNVTVVRRYRSIGEPIWATSTVVDRAGLAKAEEIIVVGGILPADKKVPYDKIVTTVFAEKAQQKIAGK
jgi:NitT/TauT family transport system substrate-binding protein